MAAAEGKKRYQARVSIDERLGDLWMHLEELPERSRVSELIFLAQLGLVTKRAVIVQADRPLATSARVGVHSASSSIASPDTATAAAAGGAGDDVQALEGWKNVEMNFSE